MVDVRCFSPCKVMAYYALFFVVRADSDKDGTSVDTEDVHGRIFGGGERASSLIGKDPGPILFEKSIEDHISIEDIQPTITIKESKKNIFDLVPVLTLSSSSVKNDLCRNQSLMYYNSLRNYEMWAMKMFDSSAKLPPGIIQGNTNQYGDFDQCIEIAYLDNYQEKEIKGKYCLALVDVEVEDGVSSDLSEVAASARAKDFLKSSRYQPGHFIPLFGTMDWGFCIPNSCLAEDLESELTEILDEGLNSTGLTLKVHVSNNMCYEKEKKQYSSGTCLTCLFLGTFISLPVIAYGMEKFYTRKKIAQQGKLSRMVMAFSLKKTLSALVGNGNSEDDISCIHGVRAICTCALYLAHKVITLALMPLSNRTLLTQVSHDPSSMLLRSSIIYTDSFLYLSGLLTAFNLSKDIIQKRRKVNLFQKFLMRYIRLTPALLSLVLFYGYIFEHIGSGPQWKKMVNSNAELCKGGWWKNIFYIQNFFLFEEMCATHTHQLALDMQLSFLTLLLIPFLVSHFYFTSMVLVLLQFTSAFMRYYSTMNNNLSLIIYHGISLSQLYKTANLAYSLPFHRATPYLTGITLGYILQKKKNIYIPKPILYIGWLLAIFQIYYSTFYHRNSAEVDFKYDVYEASLYAAFAPVSWSLVLSWTIFVCATGNCGLLNKFLCCQIFKLFSRISYSVYLIQFAVFFYRIGTIRYSQEFIIRHAVDIEELLVVILVSIVTTLIFDLPMQEIKNIIFYQSGTDKKIENRIEIERRKKL